MSRAASRHVDDGLPWSEHPHGKPKPTYVRLFPPASFEHMQTPTDFGRMRALTREPGKPKEWRRPPCRRRSNVEHDASSLGRCRHGGGSAQDMVPFGSFCRICEPQIADRHLGKKSLPANRLFKSTEVVYDCRQARQSGKAKPDFSIHPRISVKNCQREDASERKCWKQAMRNGAETDNENGGSRRRERRERCGIGRRKRRGRERRRRASTARRAERERTSAARQHRSGRRRRALHIGHAHARWLRNKRVYNDARVQRHGALPTPPATQPNRRVFAGQKG